MKNLNKQDLYNIIFLSDTPKGKLFDLILLWSIVLSILVTIFDSLPSLSPELKSAFYVMEWIFTLMFTVEYALRIYVSHQPTRYIFSFWGIIDLLAIIPTYISLFVYGTQYLLIVRILRLLRIFRILKLMRYYSEALMLMGALKASVSKITIFLFTVTALAVILGAVMFVVEGEKNGFTSIPQSIYWAIVTITTVGYGDMTPKTPLGKIIASITMILGYAIIAVPTGILTVEIAKSSELKSECPKCNHKNKEFALFCNQCGSILKVEKPSNVHQSV